MKKLFILLLMAVTFCEYAEAQKGTHSLGLNIGTNFNGGSQHPVLGGGLKYQYYILNFIRIEPSAMVYPEELENTLYASIMLNGHFFLVSPKKWRPYIFAGFGYLSYKEIIHSGNYQGSHEYQWSHEDEGIGFNGGVGLDYRFSYHWSLQTEIGLLGNIEHQVFNANIGISYNF